MEHPGSVDDILHGANSSWNVDQSLDRIRDGHYATATIKVCMNVAGALLITLLFLKGRQASRPFKHPPLTMLLCFSCLIASCYVKRNEIMRHDLSGATLKERMNNLTGLMSFSFVLGALLTVPMNWQLSRYYLTDIKSRTDDPASGVENDATQYLALARDFAIVLDDLANLLSKHPVLVFFHRKKLRRLRSDIHRIIMVAELRSPRPPYEALSTIIECTNCSWLLALASDETLSKLKKVSRHLTVGARAAIVEGMQKAGLQSPKARAWVGELLMSACGLDLTMLKNKVDAGGDYHSLHKLVYFDLGSGSSLQRMILDHFARDAAPEDLEEASFTTDAEMHEDMREGNFKIVSDIDDTLLSSGGTVYGHGIAGCDNRFPKHIVYPGILQLFLELDSQWKSAAGSLMKKSFTHVTKKQTDVDKQDDSVLCNLTFLSARPHIYRDVMERPCYSLFRRLKDERRLHCMPTMVPGRLSVSLCAAVKHILKRPGAWHQAGIQKFISLQEIQHLYPEYQRIFFGDTGQGDLVAAELAAQEQPPLISMAFIHEVLDRDKALSIFMHLSLEEREAQWKKLGIHICTSPIQAAQISHQSGLISNDALRRVLSAAVQDFESSAVNHPHFLYWRERCEELNADLLAAQTTDSPRSPRSPASLPFRRSVHSNILQVDGNWLDKELRELRMLINDERWDKVGGDDPFSITVAIVGLMFIAAVIFVIIGKILPGNLLVRCMEPFLTGQGHGCALLNNAFR